jgi:nucleotide-binding universal stress UspA family protein
MNMRAALDLDERSLRPTPYPEFKSILVATDLSVAAEHALPFAVALARRFGATMHIVHALHPDVYPFALPETWPALVQAEGQVRDGSLRKLESALPGIPHDLTLEKGPPWQVVSKAILRNQVDLLVLGTHGRFGLGKALMGSVAEEIFRQATCPVLTIGPHAHLWSGSGLSLNRILYATDLTPASLAAAPYAISLAKESRAQLTLFHCTHSDRELTLTFETLREVVPWGTDLPYAPDCVVKRGIPREEVLRISHEENADLIVLGIRSAAHWHLPAIKRFGASMTYEIVTRAACPVLTIRS